MSHAHPATASPGSDRVAHNGRGRGKHGSSMQGQAIVSRMPQMSATDVRGLTTANRVTVSPA